jgi:hypothetical protein
MITDMIELVSVAEASRVLVGRHYLGPTSKAAFALRDEHGVLVFARPRGRNVPMGWLEVVRWCLLDGKGSMQWSAAQPFLRREFPDCSTIISYSDPSVGHTGALYRACNWLWAPTWHRLRPPPTGNGAWSEDKAQAVKDRWIFPLAPDEQREAQLSVKDDAVMRAMPWASYREPRWRKGRFDPASGGGDFKRFVQLSASAKVA